MSDIQAILASARTGVMTRDDMRLLLSIEEREQLDALFAAAYAVKQEFVGKTAYYRGIVEFSNICRKDCYYCGIRRSKPDVERFMMKEEEILKGARWAHENNFGSVVLQSGERSDPYFVDFVEDMLRKIKALSDGKLGITLSLGEQSPETYRRWFEAGAHRYLLRIETSNRELYAKMHPPDHDYNARVQCLYDIRDAGYQVGTGVMIGLPLQTIDHLVDDIEFFREMDIDMVGMGPFIVSDNTPVAELVEDTEALHSRNFILALKMISVVRLQLKDVNIAATTALQALKPLGREMGLKAGANIIMPNVSETIYRKNYQLYNNKPCIDEDSGLCSDCLERRIVGIDEEIGYGEWGDSPHFRKRNQNFKLES